MNPLFLVGVALLYTTGAQSYVLAPCFVAKANSKGLIGSYTPQCTDNGFFEVIQHHGSTGASWCAHPETGVQVGERTGPTAVATCGKCLHDLSDYLGNAMPGRTKPSCDENGKFNLIQSSGSTGYSWCVNTETGEKIPGSDKAPGMLGLPNCGASGRRSAISSIVIAPCFIAKAHSSGLIGSYTPQCTDNGFFEVIQHHGSTGASWCAHPVTGKKVGQPTGPTEAPTCGKCLHDLSAALSDTQLVGSQKPSCDANGKYNMIQSSGSTGYSWCVNPETGEKIPGSDKAPGLLGLPNCAAAIAPVASMNLVYAPCLVLKAELESKQPMPGQYIPQCDNKGFFNSIQFNGSTGHRFCVNTNTGEQIGESIAPGENGKLMCEN